MSSSGDRRIDNGWRGGQSTGRGSWRGGRGSWQGNRGQSRGGRGGSGHGFRRPLEPQNWTLGPLVESVELSQLLLDDEAPIINNVRYAASYSWLESDNPVIAVPGKAIRHMHICLTSFS
jgi:hypothetical protein